MRLLGPVDVVVGGGPRPVGGSRRRAVLAVLALHPGDVVGVDLIVDAVWGRAAPSTALNTVQRHVSALRQVLGARGAVVARPRGYVLESDTDVADAQARIVGVPHQGDVRERRRRLEAALALWRGPSLFDVGGTAWLDAQSARLESLRRRAGRDLVEARLSLGEHTRLVPGLETLAQQAPFDEEVHGQLMLALYRAGRQTDALAVFRRLETVLATELGIDPGAALRDLHGAILRQDETLRPAPETADVRLPVPAQLPPALVAFTGRSADLARLDSLMSTGAPVVVSGTAGVGKTALVTRWAHAAADRFPDGQLYVDLRGFSPEGQAGDVVRGFLDAWAIPPDRLPRDLPARIALYRSLLAGKRVLVVLDNARDAAQVRPLLPAGRGCAVVVTSRNRLEPLVAGDGARLLTLEPLDAADARELLAARVGAERIREEPGAVDEIVARCAGLPLALAVVAARALTRPVYRLADHAGALRGASALDALADVRTVLSWSHDALNPDAARLFRHLGPHPGPTVTTAAAASLVALPVPAVRALLADLVDGSLLAEPAPGRFALHDLLHAFARERGAENAAERPAVVRRMVDHYLHSAHAAADALGPRRDRPVPPPPADGVVVDNPVDGTGALRWFAAERPVLLAVLREAERAGLDEQLWHLAWTVAPVFDRHGHWTDSEATQRAGLAAAGRIGDRHAQARLHRTLGRTLLRLDRADEARRHLDRAVDLAEESGDPAARGHAQLSFAEFHDGQGREPEALTHARRALALFRAGGDELGGTLALNAVGWFAARTGEFEVALAHCRQALASARRTGQRAQQAHVLDSLGLAHHGLGRRASAVRCYRQAAALFAALESRYEEATARTALAGLTGDAAELRVALALLDDLGHPDADEVRRRLRSWNAPAQP